MLVNNDFFSHFLQLFQTLTTVGEQFVTSRSANALEDETANDIASKDHRPNHLPVANSMPQVIAEMPSRKIGK